MAQLTLPLADVRPAEERLGPGALLLRGWARRMEQRLLADVLAVAAKAPFRQMQTPGGLPMSAAMTNCGSFGWVSDHRGYRYQSEDPSGGAPWPPLPGSFAELARAAAEAAGFANFAPDACLINRYEPGAGMTLHQDRNERDFSAPIVSVSLGLPATFLWGGAARGDRPQRIGLEHGDVVVWGGPDRLRFHGVRPIPVGTHPQTGACRYNLTLRRAC